MYEGSARRGRETRQVEGRIAARVGARPDRIALWAVFMAMFGVFIAIATANADSGGISGGGGVGTSCDNCEFGDRSISQGDSGRDVGIVNYILRSKKWSPAHGVSTGKSFDAATDAAVREFQQRQGLPVDGEVDVGGEPSTKWTLIHSMHKSRATWYGPGLWGNPLACGGTLRKSTTGVAHRTKPCGSRIVIRYRGKSVRTKVIDRGPFANGANWDLTRETARRLGFDNINDIRVGDASKWY